MKLTLRAPCVAMMVFLPLMAQAQLTFVEQKTTVKTVRQGTSLPAKQLAPGSVSAMTYSWADPATPRSWLLAASAEAGTVMNDDASLTLSATVYNAIFLYPIGFDEKTLYTGSDNRASAAISVDFQLATAATVKFSLFSDADSLGNSPAPTFSLQYQTGGVWQDLNLSYGPSDVFTAYSSDSFAQDAYTTLAAGLYRVATSVSLSQAFPQPRSANGKLRVAVVPEPSSWALMALGLGALAMARRRSMMS